MENHTQKLLSQNVFAEGLCLLFVIEKDTGLLVSSGRSPLCQL